MIEREALIMIYSINKFRHYLLGKKFIFHVDHTTLLYLVSKQTLIGKLVRLMLLLQEIQHRLGTQHAIADYLSHIENGDKALEGDDDFPNGKILQISTSDPRTTPHPRTTNGFSK